MDNGLMILKVYKGDEYLHYNAKLDKYYFSIFKESDIVTNEKGKEFTLSPEVQNAIECGFLVCEEYEDETL